MAKIVIQPNLVGEVVSHDPFVVAAGHTVFIGNDVRHPIQARSQMV
jgi:hypothetical protein